MHNWPHKRQRIRIMAFFPPQQIRATSETFSFPIVDASLQFFRWQCLLLDSPVNAAVNSQLSINLLSRQRASVHAINKAVSIIDLPVTACFLGQGRSTILLFVISEEDLGFEIILGSQWDLWCSQHKGKQKYAVLIIAFFQVSTCYYSASNGERSAWHVPWIHILWSFE